MFYLHISFFNLPEKRGREFLQLKSHISSTFSRNIEYIGEILVKLQIGHRVKLNAVKLDV